VLRPELLGLCVFAPLSSGASLDEVGAAASDALRDPGAKDVEGGELVLVLGESKGMPALDNASNGADAGVNNERSLSCHATVHEPG
jgi:hypothetical protein